MPLLPGCGRRTRTRRSYRIMSVYDELMSDPTEVVQIAAAELAMKVVDILNRAMSASGMTQRQVAKLVGVGEPRVSQVLGSDGNVRISSLAKFTRAMGYELSIEAVATDGSGPLGKPRPRRPASASADSEPAVVWSQTFALPSGCLTVPVVVPPIDGVEKAEPMGPPIRKRRRQTCRTVFRTSFSQGNLATEVIVPVR